MRSLSLARSHGLTVLIALCLIAASYLPPTYSQSNGPGGTSSLPPLPSGANPGGGNTQFTSSGLNVPSASPYSPSIAVVGQSNVAATQTHLMSSATLSNGTQQVVLVDPSRLTMVVYHIDPSKGDVQLKSVRRLDADFALEEFNLGEPTPSTIRKNLRLGNER